MDPSDVDPALSALTEDQTLGRYELLTPIGRGGMAVVWAARVRGSHGFSKIVAVKTMLPALSSDPRFEKMFLAEAKIAARIEHPNVCEIVDVGEDRGIVYLVMDWIDGEPLSCLLEACKAEGRAIPCGVAARIIAQAARGLHAAHGLETETGEPCPVIHRDVSPQNILVTCGGLVKIVDFGVARAAERSERTTETGFIKGKVAYLAPEQIESRAIDIRVDVFALGIVLYELVSGEHPFAAETDLATLLAIASPDPAPRLPGADDAYPPKLRAIIERALEKDPEKRYPSMRELALALEAFAAEVEHERAGPDDVSTFVTEVLGARRTKRAKELREAARSADLRSDQRESSRAIAVPASDPAIAKPRDVPAEDGGAPAPAPTPAPSRRRALFVVMVGVAGIGMGAIGLRASQVATRPAEAMTAATATAATSATTATSATSATITLAAPPIASSALPPPPVAPSAVVPARSPAPGRAMAATAKVPATPASANTPPSRPAPSTPAAKKSPLDGWD